MVAVCQTFYEYEDILDAHESQCRFALETLTKRTDDALAKIDITDMIVFL